MHRQPLIAVCGPTASGKTALSIAIAKAFNCEIVSCDSMQIYKGMNIATAKPTPDELSQAKHHLVDFVEPDEQFSVADYVDVAKKTIGDIVGRGFTPLICGGTGLYLNSLLDDISFDKSCTSTEIRNELYALAKEKGNRFLLDMLAEFDPESAERLHENNLNRIIRAIEVYKSTGKTITQFNIESKATESPYDAVIIGINYRDRQKLYDRINLRVDKMIEEGLLDEAKLILSNPTLKTAHQAIGYKELAPYFDGTRSFDECIENLKMQSRRYAKRQLTWFRRDERIRWLYADDYGSFEQLVDAALDIIRSSNIDFSRKNNEV